MLLFGGGVEQQTPRARPHIQRLAPGLEKQRALKATGNGRQRLKVKAKSEGKGYRQR